MRNIINRKEDTRVQSKGVPFAPPSPTTGLSLQLIIIYGFENK